LSSDCLFCDILAGDIPSTKVASSPKAYAFRDLNPVAPTHVLVVPRVHIENATTIGAEEADVVAEMFELARDVAKQEGILEGGYRLVFNVGEDTGNSVPHLHLHVIGGRKMAWPPG
jgi:histidine triad (HIT) family protein